MAPPRNKSEGASATSSSAPENAAVHQVERDQELKAAEWITEVEGAESVEDLDTIRTRYGASGSEFATVADAITKRHADLGVEEPEEEPVERQSGGETAFTKERLLAESDVIAGVPRHVMAGALHEAQEENYTREAAKALVEAWQAREVATEEEGS